MLLSYPTWYLLPLNQFYVECSNHVFRSFCLANIKYIVFVLFSIEFMSERIRKWSHSVFSLLSGCKINSKWKVASSSFSFLNHYFTFKTQTNSPSLNISLCVSGRHFFKLAYHHCCCSLDFPSTPPSLHQCKGCSLLRVLKLFALPKRQTKSI